jgi:uncharacterized membrane protein YdjX (TVP38/TMEM64 family)
VAVAWGALLVAYLVAMRATGLGPLGALQALVALLADHPAGPLAFALAYVLRPLLLFSATVLTVGAGHLYGPWLGFVVVLVGANGGALLAYGLARWLSGPWATRLLASPRGGGLATRLRDRTFETVLTLRFLFAPYDAVNYLAGALRLRPVPFVLATALGSVPGSLTFLLFGASIGDLSALADGRLPSLDARALAASATLFVASLLASRALRRRVAHREAAAAGSATAAGPAAAPSGPTEVAP